MKQSQKLITLITAILFALVLSTAGQPPIELNFQGLLTDGEGQKISNESFELTVKLMSSEPGKTELWSEGYTTHTDDLGWFSFSVLDISAFLMKEGDMDEPLVIRLEFLPADKTKWIRQGEDFMVSYTIVPTTRDNATYIKMFRMEGMELTIHSEDHLYVFKDEYPFAYLTGGFLLTDAPPLNQTSVDDLRHWMVPDTDDSGAATRGVKGGFPQGGYRKR
jgi:hypothetical protein